MTDRESQRTSFKCGCSPAADNVKLFRFPKPGVRNLTRCELWAKYIFPDRNPTIELQRKLHSEHRMLCQKHFKDDFTDDSKKIIFRSAVPSDADIRRPSIPTIAGPLHSQALNQSPGTGNPTMEPEAGPSHRQTPFVDITNTQYSTKKCYL